ncbi:MAG: CBS domain-containing protein [Gammaproteobacteria bacterium]|nr:CBS domain-containing protein [Gammaproteobacteria bacterium]
MRTASDVIRHKGDKVWSVSPDDKVLHALGVMAEHDIGAVLVLDGEKLIGILTERDYARKVVLAGRSSKDSPIREVMTSEVICVSPQRTVEECLAVMTEKRVRHLPVIDHKRVVGLISIGDLVRETIAEQEYVIEQLQHYIAGY